MSNEERHNLYSSQINIKHIKSREIGRVEKVACMGQEKKCTGIGGKARREETARKTEAIMELEWNTQIKCKGYLTLISSWM